jgi:hypothetical protein
MCPKTYLFSRWLSPRSSILVENSQPPARLDPQVLPTLRSRAVETIHPPIDDDRFNLSAAVTSPTLVALRTIRPPLTRLLTIMSNPSPSRHREPDKIDPPVRSRIMFSTLISRKLHSETNTWQAGAGAVLTPWRTQSHSRVGRRSHS